MKPELADQLRELEDRIAERAKSMNRQRDFVEWVTKAVTREPPNFSVLQRLLALPARAEVVRDTPEADPLLASLDAATKEAWNHMRLTAIGEFVELAQGEGLEVTGQPPRLTLGRGIDVAFSLQENRTVVNGVQIQSVDPRDVLERVQSEQARFWGGKFDATTEMDRIYSAYQEVVKSTPGASEGVSILAVYERVRSSVKKSQQAAYTKQFFASRLSRLIEGRVKTSDGQVIALKPIASRSEALAVFLPDEGDWAYRGRILFEEAR